MLRAWSCLPPAPRLRWDPGNEATPLKILKRNPEGLAPHPARRLCRAAPRGAGPRVPGTTLPSCSPNPALGGSEAARCSSGFHTVTHIVMFAGLSNHLSYLYPG